MKFFLLLFTAIVSHALFSQVGKFNQEFRPGYILVQDGPKTSGLLKIYLTQSEKLKFKVGESGTLVKYSPDLIQGFEIDSSSFRSLFKLELFGAMGKKRSIHSCFGQEVSSGKIEAYYVYLGDYNPFANANEVFLNLYLVKRNGERFAVPILHRFGKKRFLRIKEELMTFFADEPDVQTKIESLDRANGFADVVNFVKEYNGE